MEEKILQAQGELDKVIDFVTREASAWSFTASSASCSGYC